ncbi:type IV secretion system DNA-binding domain-containing protein [Acidithiobacillus sp.]|uniref:type IV secretion system DNA-binding domain-containing protein n=1 Tax=Acidithiobacillus sp. TaxID=1872118 RepID=UPI0023244118|nr:type IV secretion system DNA-binding domain-containing protein [Acidithiobacillus sp.]MDA8246967.1 type IV secretion system DNA-binding domain-containing protein [Acidithiobacillus sp.]
MFKKFMNKAREIAAPERIAAVQRNAASLASHAASLASSAKDQAQQALADRKQRQQEESARFQVQSKSAADLHPDVQRVLSAHARNAEAAKDDAHMRGSALIDLTSDASRRMLREKTPDSAITIGGVPLDSSDEQQHILLAGAPGTGKSVEIKKALRTIRERGQRAVVYDPSGEFTSLFYRPGIDFILNPLDERGAKWNPWLDAESYEYAAVTRSFIPDKSGSSDPYWASAARAVFEALLMQCNSIDEIVYLGLSGEDSALAEVARSAGFGGMIGAERTFQSTRATLAVYLRSFALMQNCHRDDESAFSFKKWANDERQDAWVFLPSPAKARDAIRPLVSLFLDTAVRHIMALRPDPDRRIWLELDELPTLQNIPSLSPALAEGRKFGIAGILGIQTFHQLKDSFGAEVAQAVWGLPKTRLYFRISDADTSEMISKELGEKQIKRKTHSTSENQGYSDGGQGSNSNSSSSSTSEQVVIERIVLPAEISGLPNLFGYLRTGGSHRVAKVFCEYGGIPRRGEQEDFIWKRQRALPTAASIVLEKGEQGMEEQIVTSVPVPTKTVGTNENSGLRGVELVEEEEAKIRNRALELMQESMGTWDDQSIAALTDSEITELTGIFIERAEIEVAGGAAISTQ